MTTLQHLISLFSKLWLLFMVICYETSPQHVLRQLYHACVARRAIFSILPSQLVALIPILVWPLGCYPSLEISFLTHLNPRLGCFSPNNSGRPIIWCSHRELNVCAPPPFPPMSSYYKDLWSFITPTSYTLMVLNTRAHIQPPVEDLIELTRPGTSQRTSLPELFNTTCRAMAQTWVHLHSQTRVKSSPKQRKNYIFCGDVISSPYKPLRNHLKNFVQHLNQTYLPSSYSWLVLSVIHWDHTGLSEALFPPQWPTCMIASRDQNHAPLGG